MGEISMIDSSWLQTPKSGFATVCRMGPVTLQRRSAASTRVCVCVCVCVCAWCVSGPRCCCCTHSLCGEGGWGPTTPVQQVSAHLVCKAHGDTAHRQDPGRGGESTTVLPKNARRQAGTWNGSARGIHDCHSWGTRASALLQLVAAIVFISFGVVAAFCCAIVDGVFAARHIELRPLTAGRCQFYSSGVGYVYDVYQTEVTCHSWNSRCQLKVRSNTCYCCDLYTCESAEPSPTYYEFVGVRSCQDVVHLYRLLWASAALNVLGLLLGIITAAILGAFKDVVPLSRLALGPSAPPQILYSPAQQVLAYAGFCRPPATVPTCSSYPLPLQ
ncbi:transmembrane protein 255B isoform X2 [Microcebus murinus]